MHNPNTLRQGTANFICDRCGRKVKNLRAEWTGLRTCTHCWDPRHPVTLPLPMALDSQPIQGARPRPNPFYITNVLDDLTICGVQYQLGTTLVPNIQCGAWHQPCGGVIGLPFNYINFPNG